MAKPREEQLGGITVLDEDSTGTVDCTNAALTNVLTLELGTNTAALGDIRLEDGGTINSAGSLTVSLEDSTVLDDTGANLTLQAQNATNGTTIGGDVVLTSGTGTDKDGYIVLKHGSVEIVRFGEGSLLMQFGDTTDAEIGFPISSGAGVDLDIKGQESDTGSAAGNVSIVSGKGNIGGAGGTLTLSAGDGGSGGDLVLTSGGCDAVKTGDISITTPTNSPASGKGAGSITLETGHNASGNPGDISLITGGSDASGPGNISLTTASVTSGGGRGSISLTTGTQVGGNNGITLAVGATTGGLGGHVAISSGDCSGGAPAGNVTLTTGDGVANGGNATITTGAGSGGPGGNTTITCGSGSTTGGNIICTAGAGTSSVGGYVSITAGTTSAAGAAGGNASLYAGSNSSTGYGGTVNCYGGSSSGAGGGSANVYGGQGATGGGHLNMGGGTATTSGSGGNATMAAGPGVSAGGNANVASGAASAGTGGTVSLTSGAGTTWDGYISFIRGITEVGKFDDGAEGYPRFYLGAEDAELWIGNPSYSKFTASTITFPFDVDLEDAVISVDIATGGSDGYDLILKGGSVPYGGGGDAGDLVLRPGDNGIKTGNGSVTIEHLTSRLPDAWLKTATFDRGSLTFGHLASPVTEIAIGVDTPTGNTAGLDLNIYAAAGSGTGAIDGGDLLLSAGNGADTGDGGDVVIDSGSFSVSGGAHGSIIMQIATSAALTIDNNRTFLLADADVVPTSDPSTGAHLYVESGATKIRSDNSVITTIAPVGKSDSFTQVIISDVGTVDTSDDTETVCLTVTIPTNYYGMLSVRVTAEEQGSPANAYGYQNVFLASNDAGVVTIRDNSNTPIELDPQATGVSADVDANAATFRVQVTGNVGEDWDWNSHVTGILCERTT